MRAGCAPPVPRARRARREARPFAARACESPPADGRCRRRESARSISGVAWHAMLRGHLRRRSTRRSGRPSKSRPMPFCNAEHIFEGAAPWRGRRRRPSAPACRRYRTESVWSRPEFDFTESRLPSAGRSPDPASASSAPPRCANSRSIVSEIAAMPRSFGDRLNLAAERRDLCRGERGGRMLEQQESTDARASARASRTRTRDAASSRRRGRSHVVLGRVPPRRARRVACARMSGGGGSISSENGIARFCTIGQRLEERRAIADDAEPIERR